MSIHQNSIESYWSGLIEEFPERTKSILIALQHLGQATDRQIMEALDLTDPNGVRPRITEAIRDGLLVECGTVRDLVTDRHVRLVCIAPDPRAPQQQDLAL